MIHFPKKRYTVVKEAKVGPNATIQLLHATSREPDGIGGEFTRNYHHVVLVGKGDKIAVEFPVDVREGNFQQVFKKAVKQLT